MLQVHCPDTHDWPVAHTRPHWPQLFGSLLVSTQPVPPPHRIWPPGQVHTPEAQVAFAPHTRPHWPQLSGSVETVVQALLQTTWPTGHVVH